MNCCIMYIKCDAVHGIEVHCIGLQHIRGLSFARSRIKIPTIASASLDASQCSTSQYLCTSQYPCTFHFPFYLSVPPLTPPNALPLSAFVPLSTTELLVPLRFSLDALPCCFTDENFFLSVSFFERWTRICSLNLRLRPMEKKFWWWQLFSILQKYVFWKDQFF